MVIRLLIWGSLLFLRENLPFCGLDQLDWLDWLDGPMSQQSGSSLIYLQKKTRSFPLMGLWWESIRGIRECPSMVILWWYFLGILWPVGGDWNHGILYDFPETVGVMSSSRLIFVRGVAQPKRSTTTKARHRMIPGCQDPENSEKNNASIRVVTLPKTWDPNYIILYPFISAKISNFEQGSKLVHTRNRSCCVARSWLVCCCCILHALGSFLGWSLTGPSLKASHNRRDTNVLRRF